LKKLFTFLVYLVLLSVAPPSGAWASSSQSFALGPPDDETPVVVKAGFFLKDINAVDEETQTFEFEGTLTLQWKDPRQTFDAAELGVSERTYQGAFQFNEVFTGWWVQMVLANESRDYDRQGILLRIRPDGTLTYTEEVNGVAESPMRLSRFPFDRETFPLRFQVMGYDEAEVILEVDSTTTGHLRSDVSAVQWRFRDLRVSTRRDTHLFSDGGQKPVSTFVVEVDLTRNPGFMLRVVVIPLALLVMLTWSVFWMDRESLGDRMDISFIGILTIVAYQIMISEHMPRIPYITLMAVFLYLSFAVLIASVVVNLVVGRLDRTGQKARGDRIDHHCRWIFPLVYVGLNVLAAALFFAVF
jgi:hypothetical protein